MSKDVCLQHMHFNTDNMQMQIEVILTIYLTPTIITQANIELDASDTIAIVKSKIEGETNISADQQILIFNNEILSDDQRTVSEYNIHNGSNLGLVLN